ncbi:MAG: serine hydrolase domain-containing protein [bacterium]
MMAKTIIIFFILLIATSATAGDQALIEVADSIRQEYGIPELGYAVVSSDSVLEMATLGFKRANSTIAAEPNDRFHLGSCTKAITGFVAALMVKRNEIQWNTKFFDLYPELKTSSDSAYYDMTLADLLSHRARIQPLTENEEFPPDDYFKDSSSQRYQFVTWVLGKKPVESEEGYSYSNAGYSAAAIMLEKASGKTWEKLVENVGRELGLGFGFSWPNLADSSQPWGHSTEDSRLIPLPPSDPYNLLWVEPAGDINMSIGDFTKWIQFNLRGLQGKGPLLNKQEYEFLHYGMPDHYAIGWTWGVNSNGHKVSAHDGSADTFYCWAYIIREIDRAYIILANSANKSGVKELLKVFLNRYGS